MLHSSMSELTQILNFEEFKKPNEFLKLKPK